MPVYKWENDRLVELEKPPIQWEVKKIGWLEGHATLANSPLMTRGGLTTTQDSDTK